MANVAQQLAQALQDIRQGVTRDGKHFNGHKTPAELVNHNVDRFNPQDGHLRLQYLLQLRNRLMHPKNGGNHDHY